MLIQHVVPGTRHTLYSSKVTSSWHGLITERQKVNNEPHHGFRIHKICKYQIRRTVMAGVQSTKVFIN